MQETYDATATGQLRIAAQGGRVRVLFEGHEIADSADVLTLREAGHDPVFYFPRDDVQMSALRRTDHITQCPLKGTASYYTIYRDREVIENAAWSYEDPFDDVSLIAGRIAFYPEHVEFHLDGAEEPVRHVPAHDPPYADTTDARDV